MICFTSSDFNFRYDRDYYHQNSNLNVISWDVRWPWPSFLAPLPRMPSHTSLPLSTSWVWPLKLLLVTSRSSICSYRLQVQWNGTRGDSASILWLDRRKQRSVAASVIFHGLSLTGIIFNRSKIWLASATTSEIVENAGERTLRSSSRKWDIMKKRGFNAVQGFKIKHKTFFARTKFWKRYLIHQASVRTTETRVSPTGQNVRMRIGKILPPERKPLVSSISSMENLKGR